MADRYWVGGTGNWSDDTNHWATTDGGAPGVGNLPTIADDVHFTALSNTTAYTVTVNSGATRTCKSLLFEAAPSVSGTITFTGSAQLQVSGNLLCLSGMTINFTGATAIFMFNSTSLGNTITTNGVSLAGNSIGGGAFRFNGVGGGWTLQDGFTISAGGAQLLNGSLDLNGQTVSVTGALSHASGTFALTTGAAAITLATNWTFAASGFTLIAGAETITTSANITNAGGNTLPFGNIVFTGNTARTLPAGVTFKSITWAPSSTATLTVNNDPSLTGALTLTGASAALPLTVTSAAAQNFTAGSVSLTDIQFKNIHAMGPAIQWSGTRLVDQGGNANINFGGVVVITDTHDDVNRRNKKKIREREELRAQIKEAIDGPLPIELEQELEQHASKQVTDSIYKPLSERIDFNAVSIEVLEKVRDFYKTDREEREKIEKVGNEVRAIKRKQELEEARKRKQEMEDEEAVMVFMMLLNQ